MEFPRYDFAKIPSAFTARLRDAVPTGGTTCSLGKDPELYGAGSAGNRLMWSGWMRSNRSASV